MSIAGGFDISLAFIKSNAEHVVKNDFIINEQERSFLLTGPNQSGKTTFSRMFGQILFFGALGLPVPCAEAELFWTEGLSTHFIKEEEPGGDSGRLREELLRLKKIIEETPAGSAVILNELFSSATSYDALEMGRHILRIFEEKGCLCLYITHLFELAASGGPVSLISETEGQSVPTFKISRGTPAGNAYVGGLLAKHGLLSDGIRERFI